MLWGMQTVQKLLEQRHKALAQAFDIAHRYETTKQAASYVVGLMHSGGMAHGMVERRTRAMVIREGTDEEKCRTATGKCIDNMASHT